MAATSVTTMSRDRSYTGGDWLKTPDDVTRRVRSCDDVRRPDAADAVTSQPEPETVKSEVVAVTPTSSGAGRRRFRNVALQIVGQIFELENNSAEPPAGVTGSESVPKAGDDVTVPVLTSTNSASAECSAKSNARRAGRGIMLEELLKARARQDKVSNGEYRAM